MQVSDLVAKIRKNSREEIRVMLDHYNGDPTFNVRIFWTDAQGETRQRRNVMALRISLLPQFAEAVQAALFQAHEKGILK